MKIWAVFAFAAAFLSCNYLRADQVILKNGDRLSGQIQKLDGDKLDLKTDFADVIHIKWSEVNSLSSDSPLYLKVPDQTAIQVTQLQRQDSGYVVSNGAGGRNTIPSVEALRSSGEQTAYEKSLRPGLVEFWSGGVNFGFALARGNSKTTNLSTGTDLSRKTRNDKVSLYETSVYSTDKVLNATTANAIRGGARYDRDFNKRVFAYGSGDFEHDELQGLDVRSILGGGLGVHMIASNTTTLDLLGGIAWTRESYNTGLINNFATAEIGQEFSHRIWEGTDFRERAFFYPNLSDSGSYRAALDLGFTSRIYKRLVWQNTLSDRYVSNPLVGKGKNDLLISTGVGVTLGSGSH